MEKTVRLKWVRRTRRYHKAGKNKAGKNKVIKQGHKTRP
jgi:hypothetical protein